MRMVWPIHLHWLLSIMSDIKGAKMQPEDRKVYLEMRDSLLAAKDLPLAEREQALCRVLARFLNKRDALPNDLKKFLDN